jgi:hypothetical protein
MNEVIVIGAGPAGVVAAEALGIGGRVGVGEVS